MKSTSRIFAFVMSILMLVAFLIAILYFVFSESENFLSNIILAQLIGFAVVSLLIAVYGVWPKLTLSHEQSSRITKMALLSESNTIMNEYHLDNKTSTLICLSDTVYFNFLEGNKNNEEYAVLNKIGNDWYIERISEERNVGIKRAGEQYVYKLKTGSVYRVQNNDVVYIGNERLLVI